MKEIASYGNQFKAKYLLANGDPRNPLVRVGYQNATADFDDRLNRQPEIIGQMGGIALHYREHCLHPPRQGSLVVSVHDSLVPDIVGDVREIDVA